MVPDGGKYEENIKYMGISRLDSPVEVNRLFKEQAEEDKQDHGDFFIFRIPNPVEYSIHSINLRSIFSDQSIGTTGILVL